jgi:diacylglycerol kinase
MAASPPDPARRASSLPESLGFAVQGIWHVLRTQRNARIHAGITAAVILAGLWLGINRLEWSVVILTIALVWAAESINTALEVVVNLVSPSVHPLAKTCKDTAAGAVLVCAAAAVIIGLLIFGPPLWARLAAWLG